MNEYESLSHTTWDCKYHVVFIQKFRRKTLYLELRRHLGEVFHKRRLKSLIILKCCWSASANFVKSNGEEEPSALFFLTRLPIWTAFQDRVTASPAH